MIYIIKHKEYNNPIPKFHKELYVGDMFDYKPININEYNKYINEATGLFDIWKNTTDDIVGLCHYRRFFWYNDDYLKLSDIKRILNKHNIIITNEVVFDKGIYEQLRSEIEDPSILDKYYNILVSKEPELEEWFKFKSFSPKEMFVCKRKILDDYCEWLFELILPITEKFVLEDVNNVFNKRMLGHLIERLFAYWIWKNNLKTYKMDYKDV